MIYILSTKTNSFKGHLQNKAFRYQNKLKERCRGIIAPPQSNEKNLSFSLLSENQKERKKQNRFKFWNFHWTQNPLRTTSTMLNDSSKLSWEEVFGFWIIIFTMKNKDLKLKITDSVIFPRFLIGQKGRKYWK